MTAINAPSSLEFLSLFYEKNETSLLLFFWHNQYHIYPSCTLMQCVLNATFCLMRIVFQYVFCIRSFERDEREKKIEIRSDMFLQEINPFLPFLFIYVLPFYVRKCFSLSFSFEN